MLLALLVAASAPAGGGALLVAASAPAGGGKSSGAQLQAVMDMSRPQATGAGNLKTAEVLKSDDGVVPLAPSPFLPPLLRLNSGSMVTSSAGWPNRREEVWALVQEYLRRFTGSSEGS